MYVNAYLVVNGPRYTKHFYMEGQRSASNMGERSIDKEIALQKAGAGSSVDYAKKQQLSKEALYAAYYASGMNPATHSGE
jgi:hypothetical protein